MKVTDYIVKELYRLGVRHVFELSGGMITHLLDSLHHDGRIRTISMCHEQGAAFAADAVGRISGTPGVALATSGPGATNLITGIGSCYFDSSPAVFITGQVNREERRGDRPIRQLGFQETDIVSVVKSLTKASWEVHDPVDVPTLLRQAFRTAVDGRRGPVLIDIPMDVQRAEIDDPGDQPDVPAPEVASAADVKHVEKCLRHLSGADRPLILAGGGVQWAGAASLLRAFVARTSVPVVNSLMAVDILPHTSPQRVGMIGSYGNRWANLALAECDCLLVLGSRLDVRQTGSDVKGFSEGKHVIHVDCDAGEVNNRIKECTSAIMSTAEFLQTALTCDLDQMSAVRIEGWQHQIDIWRSRFPDIDELKDTVAGINPNCLMHELGRLSEGAGVFVVDVGQHQMWAAQSLDLSSGQRFITSGGMGAMGFALPAAIGASLCDPSRPVVCIAGDGGFQCNIQELQTVARLGLPIKIVILNNRCHGMVRQFQQSYFGERYQSTLWGYTAPSFCKVAQAYGIESTLISQPDEIAGGLAALWLDRGSPHLLEVTIDSFANAYPKMLYRRGLAAMEPER